ncbi:MAG: basic amino acid ABC transporter substrate-binding protein [Lachnospiraceae bacterium]|nr:basic amino acid ABC transporter substrate-binding protein [Lachnospiraceae bacterium]
MKRTISVVLVLCLAMGLCACASSGSGSSKKLVMATNAAFPPYESVEGNEIVGIDADIAKLIADDLGMELVIEDMAFDSIIAAVQTGKADIAMAGLTITEDRKQNINFSDPYTEAAQVILVKTTSSVQTPDDLEGLSIGVQIGTTGDIYAADIAGATIERYSKYFEAVNALLQDKIDAVIVDREPAKVFESENPDLKIIDDEFTVEEYAIGVAKENTELLDNINASLKKLKESGKIDEIIGKYIKAE